MSIRGINTSATVSYVSDFDPCKALPDQPDATRFTLGVLDAFAAAHVADSAVELSGDTARLMPSRADIETVRFGLKGWSNMPDADNADVPFTTEIRFVAGREYVTASNACLTHLPMDVLRELAREVRSLAKPQI